MKHILALDASGRTGSVCVLRGSEIAYEEVLDEGLTHSQTLLPLAARALDAAGLAPADVGLYAITAGPGSFTGLRIGMALVKGMALPWDTPVATVSTLKALALASGLRGQVISALNARRGEVYWAAFQCDKQLRRLTPDAAGPVETLRTTVESAKGPVFFVGDGAELCYNIYACGPNMGPLPEKQIWNIARGAAFLALEASPRRAALARPRYLRLSQAERERTAKLKLAAGASKEGEA